METPPYLFALSAYKLYYHEINHISIFCHQSVPYLTHYVLYLVRAFFLIPYMVRHMTANALLPDCTIVKQLNKICDTAQTVTIMKFPPPPAVSTGHPGTLFWWLQADTADVRQPGGKRTASDPVRYFSGIRLPGDCGTAYGNPLSASERMICAKF